METARYEFECRREDLTIRGWVYLPEDLSKPLPAVIISHGFLANCKSVMKYAKQFAQWGYAAFCYDFCGGCVEGRSDGKQTDMSVLTEVEDLKAVISYVKGRKDIDTGKLLLMGCSQGGFVSAICAAGMPGDVQGLILFYPALCIPDDARKGQMLMARFDPENIPEVIPCGPMTLGRIYPQDVIKMDAYEAIAGYSGPVLLEHGTKDAVVALPYVQKAYEVYTEGQPENHPEKQLVLIEDGGHGFAPQHDRQALLALNGFLKQQGL